VILTMPKLITTDNDYTCFMCGCQAFYISINSKQMRCVEKITQCPGFAKKAEESRRARPDNNERISRLKDMGVKGNKKLYELHRDEVWRKKKGENISKAKSVIPKEQLPLWEIYENKVDRITRASWLYHSTKINPDNLPRGKLYELDHKYSKHQGFLNNIPPDIIGHPANLQMIPRHSNRKKYNKCSIEIEHLYDAINSK